MSSRRIPLSRQRPETWEPVAERFWSKVKKGADNECWQWGGTIDPEGYGRFWYSGRMYGAHRMAFELTNGNLEAGMNALHHCDKSDCVNPKHLYAGSLRQNSRDCCNRRRRPTLKLGPAEVKEIRQRVAELGDTQTTYELLALQYGVSDQAIYHVAKGRTWKWVS